MHNIYFKSGKGDNKLFLDCRNWNKFKDYVNVWSEKLAHSDGKWIMKRLLFRVLTSIELHSVILVSVTLMNFKTTTEIWNWKFFPPFFSLLLSFLFVLSFFLCLFSYSVEFKLCMIVASSGIIVNIMLWVSLCLCNGDAHVSCLGRNLFYGYIYSYSIFLDVIEVRSLWLHGVKFRHS